jgi:multidrug efflux pump
MVEFAKQLQAKALASGRFFFPPVIDTKIDQPQAEVVIDHDKVGALGLNLTQVGADVSDMFGGNFVNRFNIAGRSYKVIPQVQRTGRLNPNQL